MKILIECDLRHLFGPVRDQGIRPTCVIFAASDAHAVARSKNWFPLSCEYAYFYALEQEKGKSTSGFRLDAILSVVREKGQPLETAWPYHSHLPLDIRRLKPPLNISPIYKRESEINNASLIAIRQRLEKGMPIIITMCLSETFFYPDSEGIISAKEAPDPDRRHAVIAVGYGTKNRDSLILIRNSWGEQWGREGYAWVDEQYLASRLYQFAEMKKDLTDVLTC